MTKPREQCEWCGRPFDKAEGPGRPRRYCRRSCRQRDYEARSRAAELGLNEGELVVTREELEGLRDRIFVLRCVLEDTERELAECADDPNELQRVFDDLLEAARAATVS
ncbi:MAG: hypothetical protein SGJ13_06920 [Actinomycetota bacterium]|nr:hypothetical protein [Actinomycetota bacterium]